MGVKEVFTRPKMAEYEYRIIGPLQEHNYYCAVCRENSAVIETFWGVLQPCWDCQEKGFKIIKLKDSNRIKQWLLDWITK